MREYVVETFNECFEREFYKIMKNKKNRSGQKLFDFFVNNDFVKNWDWDFILKDNIVDDKEKIINILKKQEKDDFDKIFKNPSIMEIKKEYLSSFAISYDVGVQLTISTNSASSTSISSLTRSGLAQGFRARGSLMREEIKNKDLLLNFNKIDNFGDKSINLLDDTQSDINKSFIVRQSKATANSLFKYIRKIISKAVRDLEIFCGAYYASLKIYSMNITHVLLPIYKIKLIKEGLDYKYRVNGLTLEIDKYYF